MTKNVYRPHKLGNGQWVVGFGGTMNKTEAIAEIEKLNSRPMAASIEFPDTDSGLGIGGINRDQSMPVIPSIAALERIEKMTKTDIVCKKCGASQNFGGAMFTTLRGSRICDDCV